MRIGRLLILVLAMLAGADAWAGEASVGRVIVALGEVAVERAEGVFGAPRGTYLWQGDRIRTGPGARARLRLNDGTQVTLGGDTAFDLAEYRFEPGRADSRGRFQLLRGAFRLLTGLLTKVRRPDFSVRTPLATIGIRGTEFWGGYLDGEAVEVLLIEGEHALVISNKYGDAVLEQAGQGTTIAPYTSPTPVSSWGREKVEQAIATVALPD